MSLEFFLSMFPLRLNEEVISLTHGFLMLLPGSGFDFCEPWAPFIALQSQQKHLIPIWGLLFIPLSLIFSISCEPLKLLKAFLWLFHFPLLSWRTLDQNLFLDWWSLVVFPIVPVFIEISQLDFGWVCYSVCFWCFSCLQSLNISCYKYEFH